MGRGEPRRSYLPFRGIAPAPLHRDAGARRKIVDLISAIKVISGYGCTGPGLLDFGPLVGDGTLAAALGVGFSLFLLQ